MRFGQSIARWSLRIAAGLLLLCFIAWLSAEADQWLLRRHAERLLADIQSIQVGKTNDAEAWRVMEKWGKWIVPRGQCASDHCDHFLQVEDFLPSPFRCDPTEMALGGHCLLPRLMDHIGLRNELIWADYSVEQSVVTHKAFGTVITLPVSSAYDQDESLGLLAASFDENGHFAERYGQWPRTHLYRLGRWKRQVFYGIEVVFSPREDSAIKASLMDFHLSCLTQFTPCLHHDQFLPAGWKLMEEDRTASEVPQMPASPAPIAPSK